MSTSRSMSVLMVSLLLLGRPAVTASTTLFGLVDTGELFVSTDQGETWTVHAALPVSDAIGLAAGNSSAELYLVNKTGTLFQSTDGGTNWTATGSVVASDVVDLIVQPDLSILVLTASGSVFRSTDQGVNFTAVGTLTANNVVGLTINAPQGLLYAATITGEVFESTNGGVNWVAKGAITVSNAVKVRAVREKLYVLTATGELFRSTDAAVSWVPISTLSQSGMSGLTRDGNTLVAATKAGEVATSADGTSWTWRGTLNQLTLSALATDAPATTDVDWRPFAASGIWLVTPRPNPGVLGRVAAFAFWLPQSDSVKLEIFDARGRKVAQRGPEEFGAGGHVVVWSPKLQASGRYFVRLRASSGVSSAGWSVVRK